MRIKWTWNILAQVPETHTAQIFSYKTLKQNLIHWHEHVQVHDRRMRKVIVCRSVAWRGMYVLHSGTIVLNWIARATANAAIAVLNIKHRHRRRKVPKGWPSELHSLNITFAPKCVCWSDITLHVSRQTNDQYWRWGLLPLHTYIEIQCSSTPPEWVCAMFALTSKGSVTDEIQNRIQL